MKLDLVFTDVLGPMPTTSLGGTRYAISFTDSYSRYSAVGFLKSKEGCLDKLKFFVRKCERPEQSVLIMGKSTCLSLCISNRIKREHTAPYSPHQNGGSERRWRTTVEMARCMLKTAKPGSEFWVRALHTAFYSSTRCLTDSLPKGKTYFGMFAGEKPHLSNLKFFWEFLGVLLSNTLNHIKTSFPIKPAIKTSFDSFAAYPI